MNQILPAILNDTYSLSQLKHRLRILKAVLLQKLFNGPAAESFSPEDLNWIRSLPPAFYQQFNKDNVYQVLAAGEKAAFTLSTLTLYLPFEPDENTIAQIGSYCRKTFNFPGMILDIKLDPRLIAGTALSWKGVYRDYSLRAKMAEKKQALWQEFKKFLR